MKLEMRAWDLDVRLDVEDDNQYNQLELIESVKNLLDELSAYSQVNFSVVSIPQEDVEQQVDEVEEDDTII